MMKEQSQITPTADTFTVDGCAFWDVKAVAAFLGLSLSATYKLCARCDFPPRYKFGYRCVRWKRAEVEQWAKSLQPSQLTAEG